MMRYLLIFLPMLFLSSCIDIIDDLTLNNDGSGTLKYSINLSASKVKVNSILALDSFNNQKVPSIEEIKKTIREFQALLANEPGISNVKIDLNTVDFIVKFSCDFNHVNNLQKALKKTIAIMNEAPINPAHDGDWIVWDGTNVSRIIPGAIVEKSRNYQNTDLPLLKTGTYTSIGRYGRPIAKVTNVKCKLNPSKTATFLQVNAFELRNNNRLLENTVVLTPQR
ncbi:MAG: hypothetical protein ACK438_12105 [Flavobacteriales bacterium]|jgi:hypothetical protein